ncbi:MAG: riboflavin synthase [Gemmatimonadota bacterium]|nr:riboflavin synthase [Gemmatimonadota bacterium]
MFTGIVERVGEIRAVEDRDGTRRFTIACGDLAADLSPGDSVAVDGACFTVSALGEDSFDVDVIGTSLERTVAAGYREGVHVNLEQALQMTGRIDGHLVQGHVDGLGYLRDVVKEGAFWRMRFELPDDVAVLTVERGSIALSGVSLTVAEMPGASTCTVGLIPYTYEHTNLHTLESGDPVNVEGDLIGKYVGKILAARGEGPTE